MNKDIVVIKYISDDESRKFILTVREKSISFEDFDNSMNCDQCNEKDTCELYTTPCKSYEYKFEDNCDIFDEIDFFLDNCFNCSVAIVLGCIIQGILINNPKSTVTFTFNDDLILLSSSIDHLHQQMIS